MKIQIFVNAAAALALGKTAVGLQEIEIVDGDLPLFSKEERMELAYGMGDIPYGEDPDPPIAEPNVPEVKKVLAARIAARQKRQEEGRVRRAGLARWVKEHGDDSQKERLKEGLLPEDEVLESMRDQVFDLTDTYERYTPIEKDEACKCGCYESVEFTNTLAANTPPGLSGDEYARLKEVRESAPKGCIVVARMHKAKCPECACPGVTKPSAHATIEAHGWVLTREYAL